MTADPPHRTDIAPFQRAIIDIAVLREAVTSGEFDRLQPAERNAKVLALLGIITSLAGDLLVLSEQVDAAAVHAAQSDAALRGVEAQLEALRLAAARAGLPNPPAS